MRTADGYIVHKCLNGDPEAFGLLVDRYKEGVFALAYSKLGNFHDAEDVTQEVFIKAYKGLHKLRQWESFHAWIYSITSNLCKNWIRSQVRRADREFITEYHPAASLYQEHSRPESPILDFIQEAMASLPETYRQVLNLYYITNMNDKEIARFLGISPSNVRQRLSRARAKLKEETLAMMSETYEGHRLPAGFTFRIVEATKHIQIRPMPRATALPWGLSIATGFLIAVLSLGSNPGRLEPMFTSMAPPSDGAKVLVIGEVPVEVLPLDEETGFYSYPGGAYGERPGRLVAQSQNAPSMAPGEQSEYTFVRSFPEELVGVRGGKLAIDKSGNIYVADSAAKRIQKYDPEGELLMSSGTCGEGDGQFLVLGGMDVDGSGNIYTVDRYKNRVQKFDPDGKFLMKWGTSGDGDGQFSFPNDLAVDDSGNIYVVEYANYRVQKFDPDGNFLMKWGTPGDGDGQFHNAKGITVDSSGNVYVADTYNNRIQVFDSEGNFLRKWGTKGDGNGQFYRPQDVALDASGNVFVADASNYRIQKFDSQGNFLKDWAEPDGFGQFSDPYGLTIDDSGNLYVADHSNHRIQKFDPDGNFLTTWGTFGTGNGQFQYSLDVAADSSGNVYTVERPSVPHTHRVQKFDPDGKFLKSWGSWGRGDGQLGCPCWGVAIDKAGDVYVIERSNNRVQVFDSQGNHIAKWGTQGDGDGQFRNPEGGIAVDDSGNVYVVDTGNYRIQVFDSKGKFLRKWGSQGNADGEFSWLHGIAVDSRSGVVYVADTNNYRIQVFDTKGNFLTKWGTYGDGDMDLIFPTDIAVSHSGEVYVSDTGNHRIKVYRPVGGGAVEPADKKPVKWGYLKQTELYQNYPNPFNPETWIPYRLAEDADVTISIYGISGQLVRTLELGSKPSGSYMGKSGAAYWNGRDENGESVASGVYFYAMEAGEVSDLRKMTIIR